MQKRDIINNYHSKDVGTKVLEDCLPAEIVCGGAKTPMRVFRPTVSLYLPHTVLLVLLFPKKNKKKHTMENIIKYKKFLLNSSPLA